MDVGPDLPRNLADSGAECVFVALHGSGGEDGTIQELLELVGLPYTHSRPGPARRAFDKASAKRALLAAGITTPKFVTLSAVAIEQFGAADVLGEVAQTVGLPMVVKPCSGGSALGVRIAGQLSELPAAVVAASSWDSNVLLESRVFGRELSVCVLGTDDPHAFPPVRIRSKNSDWWDFDARYTAGETDLICPPTDLTEAELEHVQKVALATYRELDLSGCGRIDIILDDAGVAHILEANVVPGMTATSLLPLAARASGMQLRTVVESLLNDAIDQHSRRDTDTGTGR
jgi:D-alanine-D-alanine ligase